MTFKTFQRLSFAGLIFAGLTAGCSESNDDGANAGSSGANAGSSAGESGASAGESGASAGESGASAGESGANAGSSGEGGSGANDTEPVDLGDAREFAILAKTGISTVPPSAITGDIGVSPAAASYITGFSLIADTTNVFATSPQVVGEVFSADYEAPTPANMTSAISDMESAFSDAAGREADVTELGEGDIGGMSLEPGTYMWSTGLLIPTDVTLVGDADAVWIFQVAGDLTVSNGKKVTLEGGALSKNIFWQVSGEATVGTTAHIEGTVLSQTAITLRTGASANGRLLAQTSVDIDSSTVVEPAQ